MSLRSGFLPALFFVPSSCTPASRVPSTPTSSAAKIRPLLATAPLRMPMSPPPRSGGELRLDTASGTRKGGATGPVILPRANPTRARSSKRCVTTASRACRPRASSSDAEIADLEKWVCLSAARSASTRRSPRRPSNAARSGRCSLSRRPASGGRQAMAPRRSLHRRQAEGEGSTPVPGAPTAARSSAVPPSTHRPPSAPDAFEKVVDRLLASPAYGERLGPALARRGPLRRHRRRQLRLPDPADATVPRLGHRRLQPRHALRPVPPRADRRRPAAARRTSRPARRLIATGYLANAAAARLLRGRPLPPGT